MPRSFQSPLWLPHPQGLDPMLPYSGPPLPLQVQNSEKPRIPSLNQAVPKGGRSGQVFIQGLWLHLQLLNTERRDTWTSIGTATQAHNTRVARPRWAGAPHHSGWLHFHLCRPSQRFQACEPAVNRRQPWASSEVRSITKFYSLPIKRRGTRHT